MHEIMALADFISKNKIKQAERVALKGKSKTNIKALYELLASGDVRNEEDAAATIYNDNPRRDIYFTRLKRQLRDRLVNTIFLIDANQPGFNDYQTAYYSCYREMVAVKILLGRHARAAAIPLAEQALKRAQRFGFTDVILGIARDLYAHYSGVVGDRKKHLEYQTMVRRYTKIYTAEIRSEGCYLEIMVNYAKSRGSKVEVAGIAEKHYKKLQKLKKKAQSYRFDYMFYQISILRFEVVNDYENTLKTCLEALAFFQSNTEYEAQSQTVIVAFMNKSLGCYIRLQQYKEGEEMAKRAKKSAMEGSPGWFDSMGYYLTICFHSRQYQQAYQIYKEVTGHPKFKQLFKNQSEVWIIFQAYIHYFIVLGKIKPDLETKESLGKFRPSKFVNQVPTYSGDKSGANISVLILQTLFLLVQGDYNNIIDRVESLNTYTHRYLRKDETYRSNCFIKMLLQLPEGNFIYKPVLRKAHKYIDALHSMPLKDARQNAELEVVPYETLWEYVVQSLKGAPPAKP